MANPQPEDAHLRIAHRISEEVMVSDFTKRQRKILDLILRLSWGCGKKYAVIPRQKDFELVGIYEVDIKPELIWLQEAKVIVINGDQYSFNKDYDQWRVSRAKMYTNERLSILLSINLNGAKNKLSNSLSNDPVLSKTLRNNLVKHEDSTKQNTKFATHKLASPKERGGEEGGKGTPPHPIKEILNKGEEGGGMGGEPSPTESSETYKDIYEKFIYCINYCFGREPNTRELAMVRDYSKEFTELGVTTKIVYDAFKEAGIHNKNSLSYVRAVVLDWQGVSR